MKKEIYLCDTCKNESEDYMRDGWLEVSGLTKYSGREKGGMAIVNIYISGVEKHFCSWKCLQNHKR